MNKHLLRFVALFLVVGLLVDPSLAAAFPSPTPQLPLQGSQKLSYFTQSALTTPILSATYLSRALARGRHLKTTLGGLLKGEITLHVERLPDWVNEQGVWQWGGFHIFLSKAETPAGGSHQDPGFPFDDHIQLLTEMLNHRDEIASRMEALMPGRVPEADGGEKIRKAFTRGLSNALFGLRGLPADAAQRCAEVVSLSHQAGYAVQNFEQVDYPDIGPSELFTNLTGYMNRQHVTVPQGRRSSYAHTMFATFIRQQLEALSARIGDDGPTKAKERLQAIQKVLDMLNSNRRRNVPAFVRDARWLLLAAHSRPAQQIRPYLDQYDQLMASFGESDRLEFHKADVKLLGRHLRADYHVKSPNWKSEANLRSNVRLSNVIDYQLLIYHLNPLLEAYRKAVQEEDAAQRRSLADAILQATAADPELLLVRHDLLSFYTLNESLFLERGQDGALHETPAYRTHQDRLNTYHTLIGEMTASLREDAAAFNPKDYAYSPLGNVHTFAMQFMTGMAQRVFLPEAREDFGLEEAHEWSTDPRRREWAETWGKDLIGMIGPEDPDAHITEYAPAYAEMVYQRLITHLDIGVERAQQGPSAAAFSLGTLHLIPGDHWTPAAWDAYPRPADAHVVLQSISTTHPRPELAYNKISREKYVTSRNLAYYLAAHEFEDQGYGVSKHLLADLGAGRDVYLPMPAADIERLQIVYPHVVVLPPPDASAPEPTARTRPMVGELRDRPNVLDSLTDTDMAFIADGHPIVQARLAHLIERLPDLAPDMPGGFFRSVDVRAGKELNFHYDPGKKQLVVEIDPYTSEPYFERCMLFALHTGYIAAGLKGFESATLYGTDYFYTRPSNIEPPNYKQEALRDALDDFFIDQKRLRLYLQSLRKDPVEDSDILGIAYYPLQMGALQLIVKTRVWVTWQADPVEFVISIAKATPGRALGRSTAPDQGAREEATHLLEYHSISPDLYDAPLDQGYGTYGSGSDERIFMHLMPYKRGIVEMESVARKDPQGQEYRGFQLNTARETILGGHRIWDTVQMEDRETPRIEEAMVGAIVKHWARSAVRTPTGIGLVDPKLYFAGGDINLTGVEIGPKTATLRPDFDIWRVAARGRAEMSGAEVIEFLFSARGHDTVEPSGRPAISFIHYLVGDPDHPVPQQQRIFNGIRKGFDSSGLPESERLTLEHAFWSDFLQKQDRLADSLMDGLDRWAVFLLSLQSILLKSIPQISAEEAALPAMMWFVKAVREKDIGETTHNLFEQFAAWVIESGLFNALHVNELRSQWRDTVPAQWPAALLPEETGSITQYVTTAARFNEVLITLLLRGPSEVMDLRTLFEGSVRHPELQALARQRLVELDQIMFPPKGGNGEGGTSSSAPASVDEKSLTPQPTDQRPPDLKRNITLLRAA